MSNTRTISFAVAVAAVSLALASCKAGGAESPFSTLDDEASALRDQFNKDAGKTRVVMLVAPT